MKRVVRISIVTMVLGFMTMADIPQLPVQLVSDAEAIFGVRRRAFRRGVIIGAAAESNAGAAGQSAATVQQQSTTVQQQSSTAQQQSASVPPQPAAGGKPLPIGTVVTALPPGCVATPVGGVEYYYGGGNFYRAVFQGNQLVYVTAKPE